MTENKITLKKMSTKKMKNMAGYLRFIFILGAALEIIGILLCAGFEIALLIIGKFSDIVEASGEAIAVSGGEMTAAELDALKPVVMVFLLFEMVGLIINLLGTLKICGALKEVKVGSPYSEKCVEYLHSGAKYTVIGGIVGIIGSIILSIMAADLTFGGQSLSSTGISMNLSFVFQALLLYLMYYVAANGEEKTDPDEEEVL